MNNITSINYVLTAANKWLHIPDQHATHIPHSVRVWSQTIHISHGQCIATFRESSTDLDGSTTPKKNEFLTTSSARRLTDLRLSIQFLSHSQ
jgi:hypothetical protein